MSEDRGRGTVSIYVRNLSYNTQVGDLRRMFERYGKVRDVYIPRDYYNGRPRGFAYLEFYDADEAKDAIRYLNGQHILGRDIVVEFARGDRKTPREMRTGGSSPDRRSSRDRDRSRSRSPVRSSRSKDYDDYGRKDRRVKKDGRRRSRDSRSVSRRRSRTPSVAKRRRSDVDRSARRDKHKRRHRSDSRERSRSVSAVGSAANGGRKRKESRTSRPSRSRSREPSVTKRPRSSSSSSRESPARENGEAGRQSVDGDAVANGDATRHESSVSPYRKNR